MASIRRSTASKVGTNKKKKTVDDKPVERSYIDYLPDNISERIYYFKHQLEMKPSLNLLTRLRIALDSEIVETRIPIKKLLEVATNKKQIYINGNQFTAPPDDNKNEIIQNEFNTNKIQYHRGWGHLVQVELSLNEKRNIMVIDILYILLHLGFTGRTDKILVDIKPHDIHHKTCCVSFQFN
jgi:hypothetical protein